MKFGMRAAFASLTGAVLVATGCETPQDNSIEEAQQCLDNASQLSTTNSSAAATMASNTCQPMIANVQTVQAGLIGVGLVLVEEQKIADLTQIANAMNQSSSAVATSLSFLVFSNQTDVTNMTVYAQMAQDPGSQELAGIVGLAYYANLVSGGNLNPNTPASTVASYLGTLSTDSTNGPPAAQALLSAQQSACSGDGSSSTICTDLTKAIGGATTWSAILSNAQTYVNNGG